MQTHKRRVNGVHRTEDAEDYEEQPWIEGVDSIPCTPFEVKRWCYLLCLACTLTATFFGLFVLYAVRNAEARSCVLTYNANGLISEAEMLEWTNDDKWPLARPTYDSKRKTCVCRDAALNPAAIPLTDPVAIWIAPGDLVSLHHEGRLPSLPDGFVSKWNQAPDQGYATKDHVKVCIEHDDLIYLWGTNTTTNHCHSSTGNRVEAFYLGYDGSLFCANLKNMLNANAPSLPPPSPPSPFSCNDDGNSICGSNYCQYCDTEPQCNARCSSCCES